MKNKTLPLILGMVLLMGIGTVAAANSLSNVVGIDVPSNAVAGNTFQANFSFDYLDEGINEGDSPFIIRLNFTSEDSEYPVWKNDFNVEGMVKKCTWTILGACIYPKEVDVSCSEIAPLTIINPIDTTTITAIPNGTFYCYNAEGDLNLNEHDKVSLYVTSNMALYPGQYEITAEMFYLSDTTAPFVLIVNKGDFNKYYKDGNYIEVHTNITDGRALSNYFGAIINSTQSYGISFWKMEGGIYYFTNTLPTNLSEGDYELRITATDTSGNIGTDNTTLKIDLTSPKIELLQPTESIYGGVIPVELNVTDAKAGVNKNSVKIRFREIKNGQICPETGGSLGDYSCTTTSWISLDYIETTQTFKKEVNTTELNLASGEYWLDAKAEDILGNEAAWIQEN